MKTLLHEITLATPISAAFGYLADYRTWPEWNLGLQHVTPVSRQTTGTGAAFVSATKVGAFTLSCELYITEWHKDRIIRFETTGAVRTSSLVEFIPTGNHTTVAITTGYELPGGITARALRPLIDPFIRHGLRHTEEHLKTRLIATDFAQ